MKAQIEKFKVNGKVYAWTYKDNQNNYPGWNFTLDKTASESLTELIDLMDECEWASKKTFGLEMPTDLQIGVPNNQNGMARWKTTSKMTFNHRKNESENHWLIKKSDIGIEIQFGIKKLTELRNAINGIPKGKGDFAISSNDDENILYFWWNLEK
ncbi:hypothetical protein [Winogradskyella sp. A2]|uniref:hypothetical protein n=1 Tax=Winogradskyella sp. A2 TaxID=3366944 RepID=UPI00398C2B8A